MRDRLFGWLGRVATRRPWIVLAVSLAVFAAGGGLATLAEPKLTWMDLLPQDEPTVVEFARIMDEFGSTEVMIASIEGPDPDELVGFATEFERRVLDIQQEDGTRLVKRVTWKEDVDFLLDHGLMLVKERDLRRMASSGMWDAPGLLPLVTAQNQDFKREYIEDGGSLERKESDAVRAIDTMWFLPATLRWFIENQDRPDGELEPVLRENARRYVIGDERYFSDDRSILIMQIQPVFSSEDMERTIQVVGEIRSIFEELLEAHPSIAANYPGPWPGKTLWGTGEPFITPDDRLGDGTGITGWHQYYFDETMTMFHDFGWGMIAAFVLVLALFVVAFRMWTSPLLAMIVLVMSIVLGMGLVGLVLGELTMMAMMFPIILLGLGVDYAVHIIGEFTRRRHEGEGVDDAMRASLLSTGKGILTGGLTTAVAFLALAFTSFRGLSDFGVSAGLGVLCTLLTSFMVLPAALVVIHRWRERRASRRTGTPGGGRRLYVDFSAIRVSGSLAYRFWPVTLCVVVVITIFMGMKAGRVGWAKDMLSIEARGLASLALNDVLTERFHIHPDTGMVSAESLDEAYKLAEALEDLPTVRMVESITTLVPPVAEQERRSSLVAGIRDAVEAWDEPEAFDGESAARFVGALAQTDCNVITMRKSAFMSGMDRLYDKADAIVPEGETCVRRVPGKPRPPGGWPRIAASEDVKFISRWVEENRSAAPGLLTRFQELFEPAVRECLSRAANPEGIGLEMLPASTRERFVSRDGGRFLITVYPRGDVWNEDFQHRFIPELEGVSPRVTGTPLLFVKTVERGGREGRKATALCFVVILLLLLLDFWGLAPGVRALGRGILAGLIALVPLAVGAVWMMGFMNLAGLELNMVNIIALPLLLGIGVDDGVHIVHRYRHEGRGGISRVLGTTGRAVLLTSLTTIAAFGSFALGLYQGFVTMGIILAVGIAVCFFLSIYLVPALIRIVELLGVEL